MLILDTHAWIWFVTESNQLGKDATKVLSNERFCGISAISCWEVAMLVEKKRIEFKFPIEQWLNLALEKVQLLPLTPEVAILASRLSPFHGDPADRIITATAIINQSNLITKDERIISSNLVKTIW